MVSGNASAGVTVYIIVKLCVCGYGNVNGYAYVYAIVNVKSKVTGALPY